jgi:hypothetical protein
VGHGHGDTAELHVSGGLDQAEGQSCAVRLAIRLGRIVTGHGSTAAEGTAHLQASTALGPHPRLGGPLADSARRENLTERQSPACRRSTWADASSAPT